MSRNTKMKEIAAEGMAEHYALDEYNSEEEEIIEDIVIHFKDQFTKKEVIRALDKVRWVEDDAYDELEDVLSKRKQKQADQKKMPALSKNNSVNTGVPTLSKQDSYTAPAPVASGQAKGNALKRTVFNDSDEETNVKKVESKAPLAPPKKLQKEESKDQSSIPALTLTKQTSQQHEKKLGEYVKIEKDVSKYNSIYPTIEYKLPVFYSQDEKQKNVNLVIVGHVDSGKSTLIGHLCHLKKVIDQKAAHKNEKESRNIGKESFKFAWVNDELEGERTRGITIDVGYKVIHTPNKTITFLDAPGHKDFVPNMIQGVTQADYALLVIEGSLAGFERGFEFGGQTKEHAFIVRNLGVERLIVLINKMDITKWDKDNFDKIVSELKKFLKEIGFALDKVVFVPISAFLAENIVNKSTLPEAAWYTGPSLMTLLDSLEVPERKSNMPMRLNVYNSYVAKNKGIVLQGKVEGGFVQEKDKAVIIPQGLMVQVKEIYRDGNKVPVAAIGENVDVSIVHKEECEIRSGDVMCSVEHPIPTSKCFQAEITAFELLYPILKSTEVVVYINTSKVPGFIKRILAIINPETKEIIKKNPKCIRSHERAIVEVLIEKDTCMELFSNYSSYGRVVLREKMSTVGVGIITKID